MLPGFPFRDQRDGTEIKSMQPMIAARATSTGRTPYAAINRNSTTATMTNETFWLVFISSPPTRCNAGGHPVLSRQAVVGVRLHVQGAGHRYRGDHAATVGSSHFG